jgi:predicted dehydrogenase
MDNKKIRIGVIGAAGRGKFACNAHCPENGVYLTAAMDIKDSALDSVKEKFGDSVMLTKDLDEFLKCKDIDAVFVTSPDFLHEEHAVAAMEVGKHVYLEKPMAITIEGCDRILSTAMQNKVKLYLGHNMRHMNIILKMKELIDSGAIGEVTAGWCRHFVCYGGDAYFKDWHAEREKSTGLLLQKGAHDIDVLHWLCGGYTRRVTAMGQLSVYNRITDRHSPEEYGDATFGETYPPLTQKKLNPVIDVEDMSMMLMQLDNGVQCSYQQCHYTPDGWRNYTIIGTEGRIENFGDDPSDKVCEVRLYNHRCGYNDKSDKVYKMPVASKGTHGGADTNIVTEFFDYLRGSRCPTTSPIAARNSVAAGVMATHSLRNGNCPMDIPPISQEVEDYFRNIQ